LTKRAFSFAAIILFVSLNAQAARIKIKYPIVLVHGLLGFDTMVGAGEYWNGIPKELRAYGVPVYTACVSKLNSTEVRGEQLAAQIKDILKQSGAKKVNLIGHSHGGLDSRYVAGLYGEWIASVTTVATPHQGALLADKLLEGDGFLTGSATLMLNAFGKLLAYLSKDPHEQNARDSLASLTTKSLASFNKRFPLGLPTTRCGQGPAMEGGIRFYSWSGIKVRTALFDPTDYLFTVTALADPRDTDGLVERCSSHFGKVIKDDYAHNHLDLVGGMWGLVGDDKHPKDIFVEHARRLAADGV